MSKKTVAGAALIAAAVAIPGASANAHVSPGNASVQAPTASAVEPVAYYRGRYGNHQYYRPYVMGGYQTWGSQPYYSGYWSGYPGYYGGWGYPTGYWGNGWGWGPGVSVGIAPGVGIGFGF